MKLKLFLWLLALTLNAYASVCPDPDNSSLQWGEPPYPWLKNPFSANPPYGEPGTQFVKANILVAGFGRGVSCTYRNSAGDYSIWRQTIVKLPPRVDPNWIDIYTGYVCTSAREACEFYVVAE
ncbi:DUF3757 domain-containing protein [Legionella genomosp. 1]|uniref:DUF3757 domain-containing protein n=1 Tax=Legionella genomosp. 1 TaxID=1093625 RepID=UPI001055F83D|nr:DUF3757 domain-containing protein [Legionella genomosp. 1]